MNSSILNDTSDGADAQPYPVSVLFLLGLIIFMCNFTVCLLLIFSQIFSDTIKQSYILNLSVADSLQGLVLLMRGVLAYLHLQLPAYNTSPDAINAVCIIRAFLTLVSVSASLLLLTTCLIHIYVRCSRPFGFLAQLSPRTHRFLIFGVWLLVTAYAILCTPFMDLDEFHHHHDCSTTILIPSELDVTYIVLFFLVPTIIIVPIQVHLVIVVRKNLHQTLHVSVPHDLDSRWAAVREREMKHEALQLRHASTVTLISTVFVIFWVPYFAVILIPTHEAYVARIAGIICYTPALLNPFIYTWRVRTFRKRIHQCARKILKLIKSRCNREEVDNTDIYSESSATYRTSNSSWQRY